MWYTNDYGLTSHHTAHAGWALINVADHRYQLVGLNGQIVTLTGSYSLYTALDIAEAYLNATQSVVTM